MGSISMAGIKSERSPHIYTIDLDDSDTQDDLPSSARNKMSRGSIVPSDRLRQSMSPIDVSEYNSACTMHDSPRGNVVDSKRTLHIAMRTTPVVENGVYDHDDDDHIMTNGHSLASEPTSDAMQVLGSHSRDLIRVIRKLGQLNIKSTLPSLPKFVVVGDQSAGKSSIIEAICDITLPRSSGTCTRCPFEITTSTTQPGTGPEWLCKIILRREYTYDSRHRAGNDPRQFDRWTLCSEPDAFEFAVIDNKAQLDHMLRCAQLAILNPTTPEIMFKNLSTDHDFTRHQVGFSPNIVSLEICGHDLPELSLYDLPGAINRHQDENEQHLVQFIEKLTKLYVADDSTSILLACAADNDVENSTAFRFVGDCRATNRCMGVLTKADLLAPSKVGSIAKMLAGENFKIGYGWFITKQLSQEELDRSISHADASLLERRFFETDPRALQLTRFDAQFGVPAIQNAISAKLTEHIIHDLPEIIERVQSRLSAVTQEIAGFPERPLSASNEVIDLVCQLAEHVSKLIRPDSMDNGFRNAYRATFNGARRTLERARPVVVMSTPGFVPQPQCISDNDMDDAVPETPSKSRKLNNGMHQKTPQHLSPSTPRHNGSQTTPRKTPRATPRVRGKSEPANDSSTNIAAAKFTLEEIRNAFDKGSNTELPNQTNPRVTEQLIKQSMAHWKLLIENLLGMIFSEFDKTLQDSVNLILTNRKSALIYEEMSNRAHEIFKKLWLTEADRVRHIVACETHRPITYHPNLMKTSREVILKDLLADRQRERVNEYMDANPMKKLKSDQPNVDDVLGADDYRREIDAFATPLAYYDMAAARMLDTIASHLDYGVLHVMQTEFGGVMRRALKVQDETHCQNLLAENIERERARQRLLAEREKLQTAILELSSLSSSAN